MSQPCHRSRTAPAALLALAGTAFAAEGAVPMPPSFSPIREARIEVSQGMPRLLINGAPTAPITFFYNSDIEDWRTSGFLQRQVELAKGAGVHLYSMSFRTPRRQPEGRETNWEWCDQYLDAFIELDPQALFLLRIYPGPDWSWDTWKQLTPDHLALYADGSRGTVSIASDAFWGPSDDDLAAIIRRYEASPYGDRILIYEVGGPNIEMFHDQYREKGPDYNPLNQTRFRQFLEGKYGTDAAVQRAWGRPAVTLADAGIPTFEPGRFPMHTVGAGTTEVFYRTPEEQDWIDFSEFSGQIVADRLIDWARLIKRETQGRKLTLFFYGYLFELPGSFSGHECLRRVLECPEVDILASPYSYTDRGVGGAGAFMSPVDSVTAHGKLWFNEDDTRTHLIAPERRERAGGLAFFGAGGQDLQETTGILDRNLGSVYCHRASLWWMDLISAGTFASPELWRMLAERRTRFERLAAAPCPFMPAVAVLIDESSKQIVRSDWDAPHLLQHVLRDEVTKAGAAVGFYLLDDFVAGLVPPCKAYVFANAFRLEDAECAAIRERLDREGATAIWVYAPGCFGSAGIEPARVTQGALAEPLRTTWKSSLQLRDTGGSGSTPTGMHRGSAGVSQLTGIAVKRQDGVQGSTGEGPLAGLRWGVEAPVAPRLVVTDSQAMPLGRYRSDGAVSAARQASGKHTSILLADIATSAEVLRALFAQAGVHLWTRGGEVVQTDGETLVVHSGRDSLVPIELPVGVSATCPTGQIEGRQGQSIAMRFRRGETHWFELRTEP